VDVSYGNHNSTDITGDVSGPLATDRVFLRVAANFHNDDGDIKYLYAPHTSGNYDQSGNVRAELKALVTDRLTAYLSFGGGADKNDGLALVPVTHSTGSGIPGVSTAQVNQSLILGQLNQDSATSATQTSADGSLRLVYDADFATISSVTAVEGVTEVQHQDIDVTRIPFVTVHQDQTIRSVSEELRLASKGFRNAFARPSKFSFRRRPGFFGQLVGVDLQHGDSGVGWLFVSRSISGSLRR